MTWNNTWAGPVGCCGRETINALLTILSSRACLRSILLDSVHFTGDVDTVAALALGIGAQSKSYTKNLPDFLERDLEDGKYGTRFLSGLGTRLLKLSAKNAQA